MGVETDLLVLRSSPLLAQLDADALRLIAFAGEKIDLAAGDEVLRPGEPLSGAMVVLSGSLTFLGDGRAGRRILHPGDLIGEAALVVEVTAPAAAVAREPSQVLTIPRHLFRRVLTEFPANAQAMRAAFAGQLRQTGTDLARVEAKLRALDALVPARAEAAGDDI